MTTTPLQQINIKLDLTQGWINKRHIEVKQSDNETRYLVIRLLDILPLNIAECKPIIFLKRADGNVMQGLAQILNAEVGEIVFKLTNQHLAINGNLEVEVVLFKDENKIMSFPRFSLTVIDSIHDEETFNPSEEDMSILWQMIGEIQSVVPKVEGEYALLEQEINQQFQLNEANRQQAETIRQEGYTQMQSKINEVYTTSLKYRIVE